MTSIYGDRSCCGIVHIHGMGSATDTEIKRLIRNHRSPTDSERGLLLTCSLTDQQLSSVTLRKVLKDNDFKLVSRFRNVNSGNFVNVFHHHPDLKSVSSKNLPFPWRNKRK